MPAFFTRGSGHNAKAQYSERPDDYVDNVDRLAPQVRDGAQARAGADRRDEQGREDRHHRLRHVALGDHREPRSAPRRDERGDLVPPGARVSVHRGAPELHRRARAHLHRRAEPRRAAADADEARAVARARAKLRSVLHYNGLPIDARSVSDDILAQEGFEVAKRATPASASSMTGGEYGIGIGRLVDWWIRGPTYTWRLQSR